LGIGESLAADIDEVQPLSRNETHGATQWFVGHVTDLSYRNQPNACASLDMKKV